MTVRVLGTDLRAWRTVELLNAYHPAIAGEHDHRAQMLDLLATTRHPFARTQFDPGHVTASAFVVSRSHSRVLLIAHPTLGLWLQPGGHIEPDDMAPIDGARREVLEETGLVAALHEDLFDLDVHAIPARGNAPAHLHHDLRFLAHVDGLPTPTGSEKVEACWLTPTAALTLTTDRSVHRMIAKAFPELHP